MVHIGSPTTNLECLLKHVGFKKSRTEIKTVTKEYFSDDSDDSENTECDTNHTASNE